MKELATEISNYREMMSLTDKEIKFYKRQKVCHICEKVFCTNGNNEIEFKLNKKVRGHVITPKNLEEMLIIFPI